MDYSVIYVVRSSAKPSSFKALFSSMSRHVRRSLILLGLLGLSAPVVAQVTSAAVPASLPTDVPAALTAFLQKVSLAFNAAGKQPVALTLNGSADFTAGSTHENGNLQLKSSLDGSVSETWTLPTQPRSVTKGPLTGVRACSYTDAEAKPHDGNDLNCLRVVPWFAPWLASGLTGPGLTTVADVTTASDAAAGLKRISFAPNVVLDPGSSNPAEATALPQKVAVTIAYALATGLPAELSFSEVVDSEPSHGFTIRSTFAEYGLESGFMVPHHIQRFVQRTLQADIHIASVTAE